MSLFDILSHELESVRWSRLSHEEQLEQLPSLSDDGFRWEYEIACGNVQDDANSLAADVNNVLKGKNTTLEEVEHSRAELMEHIKELEIFHAEFLRRYFERRRNNET